MRFTCLVTGCHLSSELTVRQNYRSAVESVLFLSTKRFVDLVQTEGGDLRAQTDLGRYPEEVTSVLTSHVGDAAELAFAPEDRVVIEGGDTVKMDCVYGHDPAFGD